MTLHDLLCLCGLIADLQKQNARLRELLKPFAGVTENRLLEEFDADCMLGVQAACGCCYVDTKATLDDCRKAAEELKP